MVLVPIVVLLTIDTKFEFDSWPIFTSPDFARIPRKIEDPRFHKNFNLSSDLRLFQDLSCNSLRLASLLLLYSSL